MIPDEARPPADIQTRIVHRAEHPAKSMKREVRILVAYDLTTAKHEVTMNLRRYHFMVPKDWTVFDGSYSPSRSSGELPGKVEVQFIAPSKDGTTIIFSYRGRAISSVRAALFHKLLQEHKDASKTEPLTKEQIQDFSGLLGMFVGDNQYSAELAVGCPPPGFNMTSAQIVSINNTTPALAVTGEWRNDPTKTPLPEKYWYKIYLDGTGDGANVHEVLYTSDSKAAFDKNKPVFDEVLKSLTWTPTR